LKLEVFARSPPDLTSTISSKPLVVSNNATTAIAALRHGRWSFPGTVSRWRNWSPWPSQRPRRVSSNSLRFTTPHDPTVCPGQRSNDFPWPYTAGLTIDEARNELAFLATGIYGKPLLNPNVDHPRWSQKTERVIGGAFFSSEQWPGRVINGPFASWVEKTGSACTALLTSPPHC
jgi:hypothetical protein